MGHGTVYLGRVSMQRMNEESVTVLSITMDVM
jgi:hypothetical protein